MPGRSNRTNRTGRVGAIFLIVIFAAALAGAQQPARRRGLDQIDLLERTSDRGAAVQAPVHVDLKTLQLLEPLVRYSRDLERSYKAHLIATGTLRSEGIADVISQKAMAITRSIIMIRDMENVTPEVSALLEKTDAFATDIILVTLAAQDPDEPDVAEELELIRKKYPAYNSAEPKVLLSEILRQMNANFARLKVRE